MVCGFPPIARADLPEALFSSHPDALLPDLDDGFGGAARRLAAECACANRIKADIPRVQATSSAVK